MNEEFVLHVIQIFLTYLTLTFDSKIIAVIWNFRFNQHTMSNPFV